MALAALRLQLRGRRERLLRQRRRQVLRLPDGRAATLDVSIRENQADKIGLYAFDDCDDMALHASPGPELQPAARDARALRDPQGPLRDRRRPGRLDGRPRHPGLEQGLRRDVRALGQDHEAVAGSWATRPSRSIRGLLRRKLIKCREERGLRAPVRPRGRRVRARRHRARRAQGAGERDRDGHHRPVAEHQPDRAGPVQRPRHQRDPHLQGSRHPDLGRAHPRHEVATRSGSTSTSAACSS